MVLVNLGVPFEIETDVSKDVIGVILVQRDEKERLHPITFLSYKFTDIERRYLIYDKELITIILTYRL